MIINQNNNNMKNVEETGNRAWKNILRTIFAVIVVKSLLIMYVHHHRQHQYNSDAVKTQIVLDSTENTMHYLKTFVIDSKLAY